jgi:NifU-like protein involved in Fe-S cluster formation
MTYSEKLPDHYENPHNVGSIVAEDAINAVAADCRAKAPVADAALRAAD